MVFIPAVIGVILLIAAASMSRQSFLGRECFYYGELTASTFCYNSSVFTGLVIFGFVLLALSAFLFFKRQMKEEQSRSRYSPVNPAPSRQPEVKPVAVSMVGTPAWQTLREFDADIRAAVTQLEPFGPKAEERLATAYLAVNDKGLLVSIVATILADEKKGAAAREEKDAQRAAAISAREKELFDEREKRAQDTISRIKELGMVYEGRNVVSAEMYYGERIADQGWAKIVYEDGRVELRAGSSWQRVKS